MENKYNIEVGKRFLVEIANTIAEVKVIELSPSGAFTHIQYSGSGSKRWIGNAELQEWVLEELPTEIEVTIKKWEE